MKDALSYTSTPQHVFMASSFTMQKDDFTFTLK